MTPRITLTSGGESANAALVIARKARKSTQWRDVQRDGRIVTAIRVCTDCGADIANDAELHRHWRGDHDGTPCIVCGAPIVNGIGHDDGCVVGPDYGPWGRCRWHANQAYGPHGLCGICLPRALEDPQCAEGRQYARYARWTADRALGTDRPWIGGRS